MELNFAAIFIMFFCRQFLGVFMLLHIFPHQWRLPRWLVVILYVCLCVLGTYTLYCLTLIYLIPALYLSTIVPILLLPLLIKIPLRFLVLFILFMFHIGVLFYTAALTIGQLYCAPSYFVVVACTLNSFLCLAAYYPISRLLAHKLKLLLKTKAVHIIDLTNVILFFNFIGLVITRNFSQPFSWQLVSARLFNVIPTIMSLAIVLYLLNEINVNQIMNRRINNLQKLHYAEKHYFDFVIQSWLDSRKLRHDSRHLAFMQLQYAQNGEYDLLQASLKRMLRKIDQTSHIKLCNHEIIDGIAGYWNMQAASHKITFTAKIDIGQVLVPDFDLALLLGNTLENAFQATKKQVSGTKFIELKIVTKNESLLMVVRNSYDQQLVSREGVFYSSKRDFKKPGIGLQSVRNLVDKLGGYLAINTDNGIFTISMAINNESGAAPQESSSGG